MTTRRLTSLLLATGALAAVFVFAPTGGARSQAVTNGRIAFHERAAARRRVDTGHLHDRPGRVEHVRAADQPLQRQPARLLARRHQDRLVSTFEFAGSPCCQSIAVMNADGSDRTKVINGADTGSGINDTPAWSPDGQQLAFISNFNGSIPQIGTVDVDGGGLTQITTGPFASVDPDWSPDGTKIAFDRTAATAPISTP